MNRLLYPLAFARIDKKAIRHNALIIQRLARGKQVLFVIKADAYGHGMFEVASILSRVGVTWFGVSDLAEGMLYQREIFGVRNKSKVTWLSFFNSVQPGDLKFWIADNFAINNFGDFG